MVDCEDHFLEFLRLLLGRGVVIDDGIEGGLVVDGMQCRRGVYIRTFRC